MFNVHMQKKYEAKSVTNLSIDRAQAHTHTHTTSQEGSLSSFSPQSLPSKTPKTTSSNHLNSGNLKNKGQFRCTGRPNKRPPMTLRPGRDTFGLCYPAFLSLPTPLFSKKPTIAARHESRNRDSVGATTSSGCRQAPSSCTCNKHMHLLGSSM